MAEHNSQHIVNHGPVGNQANLAGSGSVSINVSQTADHLAAHGEEEVGALLRRLQEAAAAERESLADPDEVQAAIETVAAELAGERNRFTIRGALAVIGQASTAAASVLAAAEALSAALS